MTPYTLDRTQTLPGSLEAVFDFFSDPRNLARITPDWLGFRIVSDDLEMREGLRIEYRVRPLGFSQRWVSAITAYDPPHRFVDEQVAGPYAVWRHEHTFASKGSNETEVRDQVRYALPFGPLGRIAHRVLVRRQLEAIFEHRRRMLIELLS